MNRAVIATYPAADAIEEAEALTRAAGYEPVAVATQGYLFRAKYGVGSGKAEEIARMVRENDADLVIFDERLLATQAYNLARLCGVEVKDREKVILEIFRMRASTAEAKLQVQLAELEYELPKAKDKVRMARRGEQPGFFGLGKYEIDVYTRMMKSRISILRTKVRRVNKRREVFIERRRELMMPTIALAGYTAAGKTTLFNALTGSNNEVDSGIFTTLAPTTRSLVLGGRKCLVTDTVGFISNLPTYLIESFKSTLEDVSTSTVVLLVVDGSQSNDKIARSFRSSARVLSDLEVEPSRVIVVLNKADLVDTASLGEKAELFGLREAIPISARTGLGIDDLRDTLLDKISEAEESNPREGREQLSAASLVGG